MAADHNLKVFSEISDESGHHLVLRYIGIPQPTRINLPGVPVPPYDELKPYDFHSLVWDSNDGSMWTRQATISREDLELDGVRRWVSALHSFDARSGTAIIQIGEGESRVIYSWREWDLKANKEVKTIRVCDNPFEPFGNADESASE